MPWLDACLCRQEKQQRPSISPPLHLLLRPEPESQNHSFRCKVFKRPRPCNLCHQLIQQQGSCCRVCKFVCHRACETKDDARCKFVDTSFRIHRQWQVRSLRTFPSVAAARVLHAYDATAAAARLPAARAAKGPGAAHPTHPRAAAGSGAGSGRSRSSAGSSAGSGAGPGSAGAGAMDLCYVTERMIALWAAVGGRAAYRRGQQHAAHLLRTKHGDNYMVFNLSEARRAARSQHARLRELGWPSDLAPPLDRLCSVCKDMDSWLSADPQRIAVLLARGNRERIGAVVAAYMHYSSICGSADQALDRYAMARFLEDKIGELQQPSLRRYVEYFSGLLSGSIHINSAPLYLTHVTVLGAPAFQPAGGCRAFFKVYEGLVPVYTSGVYAVSADTRQFTVSVAAECGRRGLQLRGDVLLKCYHREPAPASGRPPTRSRPQRLLIFACQFHTCAVADYTLSFTRQELDGACNDLRFPLDGALELHFSATPEVRQPPPAPTPAVPVDPAADDPVTHWDSYENVSFHHSPLDTGTSEDEADIGHTFGPVDGSLYATVSKQPQAQSPLQPHCQPGAGPSPGSGSGSGQQSGPSPGAGTAASPRTASMDSGISSAGNGLQGGAGAGARSPQPAAAAAAPGHARPHPHPHQHPHQHPHTHPHPHPHTHPHAPSPEERQRELDELLSDMLLTVESIPDLPTPAPRLSLVAARCQHAPGPPPALAPLAAGDVTPPPGFCAGPSPPGPGPGAGQCQPQSPQSPAGICGALDVLEVQRYIDDGASSSDATTDESIPYHARQDSRPFTYGALPAGASMLQLRTGLASPSLVRRAHSLRGRPEPHGQPQPAPAPASSPVSRLSNGSSSTSPRSPEFHDGAVVGGAGLSWLQRQQQKLRQRREGQRGPHEARLLGELRAAQRRADGYTSDTALLLGGRDGWGAGCGGAGAADGAADGNGGGLAGAGGAATSPPGHSAPASPLLPHRSVSRRFFSTSESAYAFGQQDAVLEPPCVAVTRSQPRGGRYSGSPQSPTAHPLDLHLPHPDGDSPDHPLDSSLGSAAGLLAFADSQRSPSRGAMRDGSVSSWRTVSASDEASSPPPCSSPRPHTPAFPVHPRTPYVNSSNSSQAFEPTAAASTGLPPRSPPSQRKDYSPSSASDVSATHRAAPHSPSSASGVCGYSSPQQSPAILNGSAEQPSPSVYYGHSRRSSIHSNSEPPQEVSPTHVKFVRDTSRFWYKPTISREEAISMLRDRPPGTFVVRDSNSFPGAFGLALKVATPPPTVQGKINNINDPGSELVRHFLIEPTSRGVRLKGCANEPVFSSLSALVYQHSLLPMALPSQLLLPEADCYPLPADSPGALSAAQLLLAQGAACNVLYLLSLDMESLTGPQAIRKSVGQLFMVRPLPEATVVHFKVSGQGITLTDSKRQLFFRRHYPVSSISYCGLDPDDHRWSQKDVETGLPTSSNRVFGFIARKPASKTDNQCHIFAELEPEQPASAIVNFVSKVMMSGGTLKANIV